MKNFLASLCVVTLTACNTAGVDRTIQNNLPKICNNALTAHIAFTAVTAFTTKIPDRVIRSEQIAYNTVVRLCEDPGSVDAATVLVAATTAYLELVKALKVAKAAEAAAKAQLISK